MPHFEQAVAILGPVGVGRATALENSLWRRGGHHKFQRGALRLGGFARCMRQGSPALLACWQGEGRPGPGLLLGAGWEGPPGLPACRAGSGHQQVRLYCSNHPGCDRSQKRLEQGSKDYSKRWAASQNM